MGVKNDGTVTAMQMRGHSGMGPYRKNSGGISGMDYYACPNRLREIYPVYTNRTTSGNFRAPSDPHGVYGVESIMDDIAYQMGMDPVEFALRNMRRPTEELQFTNYSLEEVITTGAEQFDWQARRRVQPGSDEGPLKRGAGFSFMMFRAGLGTSSAVVRVDSQGQYTLYVGVTDIGPGAKTTMGMIAAEALGVPLSRGRSGLGRYRPHAVFGGRIRQPHDDHDRLRRGPGRGKSETANCRPRHAGRRGCADWLRDSDAEHRRADPPVFRRALR